MEWRAWTAWWWDKEHNDWGLGSGLGRILCWCLLYVWIRSVMIKSNGLSGILEERRYVMVSLTSASDELWKRSRFLISARGLLGRYFTFSIMKQISRVRNDCDFFPPLGWFDPFLQVSKAHNNDNKFCMTFQNTWSIKYDKRLTLDAQKPTGPTDTDRVNR